MKYVTSVGTLSSISLRWAFLVPLFASNLFSQGLAEEQRVTIVKDKAAFGEIAEVLIEKYDIPLGFEDFHSGNAGRYDFETNFYHEYSTNDGIKRPPRIVFGPEQWTLSLKFENAPLSQVLDALVEQMPNYKWENIDGVVNFMPATAGSDVFARLLDVRIATFSVATPRSVPSKTNP
ncbi:MAG: hypothetical protein ABIR33_00195 [Pyrinomonadaceae bacterium]